MRYLIVMSTPTLFNLADFRPASATPGLAASLRKYCFPELTDEQGGVLLCLPIPPPSHRWRDRLEVLFTTFSDGVNTRGWHAWAYRFGLPEHEAEENLKKLMESGVPPNSPAISRAGSYVLTDFSSVIRLFKEGQLGDYSADPEASWLLLGGYDEWAMLIRPDYDAVTSITFYPRFRTPRGVIVPKAQYLISFSDNTTESILAIGSEADVAMDFLSKRTGKPIVHRAMYPDDQ